MQDISDKNLSVIYRVSYLYRAIPSVIMLLLQRQLIIRIKQTEEDYCERKLIIIIIIALGFSLIDTLKNLAALKCNILKILFDRVAFKLAELLSERH